jgi:GT2 family glycosyltransferase
MNAVGYFHEIYGITYEDWELHPRLALGGYKILCLPVPLFWYRVAPESMSRSTSRYSNLRVVASTIQRNIPPQLAPLVDLLVGAHTS